MESLSGDNSPSLVSQIDAAKLESLRLVDLSVTTVAPLMSFDSTESFRAHSNNFPNFFRCAHISQLAEQLIHSRPVYQRFATLFPDEASLLENATANRQWYANDETWLIMFDAYKAMAVLVDIADPSVVRNGSVDIHYLIR